MYAEIQAAVAYLAQNLYNKIPRRKINLFAEQLANYMVLKFQNHWYIQDPLSGMFFHVKHIMIVLNNHQNWYVWSFMISKGTSLV